jgi:hypothetical protein
MIKPSAKSSSDKSMTILSYLLLSGLNREMSSSSMAVDVARDVTNIAWNDFEDLVALANSHHVVVRGLEAFLSMMHGAKDNTRVEWAKMALATEHARITKALTVLNDICAAFFDEKYDIAVIKSLDHWPDIGSDLDMYTNTNSSDVFNLMRTRFHAQIAPQSWGDRLANKWNFIIPGLPEAVEIHMGRLGQTGEQVRIASGLAGRTRLVLIGDATFRVPSASDRLMISTLQRMYRHFYFRLCDIVDSTALSESGDIDYEDLQASARAAGIWEGVATYLAIVSDYVKTYRGSGLDLPQSVLASARFGGDQVYFDRGFLRVPIMPQSVTLYRSQLAGLIRKREWHSGARLSLLPWLATAAAVGQKITGSDKGIW